MCSISQELSTTLFISSILRINKVGRLKLFEDMFFKRKYGSVMLSNELWRSRRETIRDRDQPLTLDRYGRMDCEGRKEGRTREMMRYENDDHKVA